MEFYVTFRVFFAFFWAKTKKCAVWLGKWIGTFELPVKVWWKSEEEEEEREDNGDAIDGL